MIRWTWEAAFCAFVAIRAGSSQIPAEFETFSGPGVYTAAGAVDKCASGWYFWSQRRGKGKYAPCLTMFP